MAGLHAVLEASLTQWSAVYGISTGQVLVTLGREYCTVHAFQLAAGG